MTELKQILPCITERYRNAFVTGLTCTMVDFEKLSANVAKLKPEDRALQDSVRTVIDNYRKYRDEVESLPLCREGSSIDVGKRGQALKKLEPCKVLKVHDDGDLTVECKGKEYVVTTEGDVFVRL